MEVDQCSATTIIEGVHYCLVLIRTESWLDELNNLPPLQVGALLTATALTWYVASGIRTALNLIGHSSKDE